MDGITYAKACRDLETFAPLRLSEEWDNTGILVEPLRGRRIRLALLAIDLTEAVVDEALTRKADLLIAYHPPIFEPLRSLRASNAKERILIKALTGGLLVYSPHTALDAIPGGVNDWLADLLGEGTRTAIQPAEEAIPHPELPTGQGRLVTLRRPVSMKTLTARLKKGLGLSHLRVSLAPKGPARIRRIALCAGAGGSVVELADADLYLTGEMRHHDVLAAQGKGVHVVLCEHTHTERGYLKVLARVLRKRWGRTVTVAASRQDRDPLATV